MTHTIENGSLASPDNRFPIENIVSSQRTPAEIYLLGSDLLRLAFSASAVENDESDSYLSAAFALRDAASIMNQQ